jgi:hypothetical protein
MHCPEKAGRNFFRKYAFVGHIFGADHFVMVTAAAAITHESNKGNTKRCTSPKKQVFTIFWHPVTVLC